MSKLPISRTIAPVSFAASSRNTAVSAASVAVLVSVRPSSFHSRPHFYRTGGPRPGHLERRGHVLYLHHREPPRDLPRFHQQAVPAHGPALAASGRPGRVPPLLARPPRGPL